MMKPYIGIVHKDSASAYGLTFPDAPGCFSVADDIDDLFTNAAEALELWTQALAEDGDTVPERRDLSAVRADPAWMESFAGAALVIAVPAPCRPPVRRAA